MKELALFGLIIITLSFAWLGSLLLVNAKTLADAYIFGLVVGAILTMSFAFIWFGINDNE